MKTFHDFRASLRPDSKPFPRAFAEFAEAIEQDERDHLDKPLSESETAGRELAVKALTMMFETWVFELGRVVTPPDPLEQSGPIA